MQDRRAARGIRYALVTMLVFIVLAKGTGEAGLRSIAPWVAERQVGLAELLGLAKAQAPCYTTYGRVVEQIEKGHSRLEKRTLTVSSAVKGDVDWPAAEQVFQLERQFLHLNTGQLTQSVVYGITSLTAQEADAAHLAETVNLVVQAVH